MLKPRQIELLEDLPLCGVDKWYSLLAATGSKVGSMLNTMSDVWREGEEPISIPSERINRLKCGFDELGIAYSIRLENSDSGLLQPDKSSGKRRRYCQLARIFIAVDVQALSELLKAYDEWDEKKLGKALGYPETAVEAYGSDAVLPIGEEELIEFDEDVKENTFFRLSKAHHQEELRVVEKWLDILRQHSKAVFLELDKSYL